MLCFRYVLRQVLRNEGKEAGRGTQYIITRVQVRARLDRAKKIRKGENSCRMGRKIPLEGWDSLSDDTKKIRKYSPRNGKNVRSGGKFIPENVDFSFEKPREKYENDENGEKNFFPCTGKNMKIIPTARKKCLKLGNGKRKKRIFLLKKFRRSIKIRGRNGKISQFPHEKNLKNIRIVRKDMSEIG